MLNTQKVYEKANKWLETAEDPLDIEDVQMYMGRIDKNFDSPRVETWIKAIHQIVKGTRLTITLNEAQKTDIVEAANMLNAIFIAYPDLTVPRTRNLETISAKLTESKIASIKADSQ